MKEDVSSEYQKILNGTVCLGYMDDSLAGFAHKIKNRIDEEAKKPNCDTQLVALLGDAARVGWELCEVAKRFG